MQLIDTGSMTGFFDVVGGTDRSQAATMNLDPGQATGGPANSHPTSDQWLFVTDGRGEAVIDGERVTLTPGILVLIEAGETHEISAAASSPLHTITIYAPPEY